MNAFDAVEAYFVASSFTVGVSALVLTATASLPGSVGTGVDDVGLAERPRDELVDVLTTVAVGVLSSFIISFDGVDARESLSLPLFEPPPSIFFGFGAPTATIEQKNQEKNLSAKFLGSNDANVIQGNL